MTVGQANENILDYIGWELDKALEKIKENGWQIEVSISYPVKGKPAGPARIIRLTRITEKKAAIIAAHQVLGEGGD
jgi:hypothetical protein